MIQLSYMQARADGQYHRCQSAFITQDTGTRKKWWPTVERRKWWKLRWALILHSCIANDSSHASVRNVGSQWVQSAVFSPVVVMREGGA